MNSDVVSGIRVCNNACEMPAGLSQENSNSPFFTGVGSGVGSGTGVGSGIGSGSGVGSGIGVGYT